MSAVQWSLCIQWPPLTQLVGGHTEVTCLYSANPILAVQFTKVIGLYRVCCLPIIHRYQKNQLWLTNLKPRSIILDPKIYFKVIYCKHPTSSLYMMKRVSGELVLVIHLTSVFLYTEKMKTALCHCYHRVNIPVACTPHWHQCWSRSHHIWCPKFHWCKHQPFHSENHQSENSNGPG